MITKTLTILVTALCFSGAAGVTAQPAVSKSSSVTATATIQAIDSTAQTVTLRDEKGQEDTSVGPEVKRFNEFKVVDQIDITYTRALVTAIERAK